MTEFGWGFHYSGPREPMQDLDCVTCLAAARKKCPTHGEAWDASCAHCAAARGKGCQSHWGLTAALEAYAKDCPAESLSDFEEARALVVTEPPANRPRVTVTMRGQGSLEATGTREFHVVIQET